MELIEKVAIHASDGSYLQSDGKHVAMCRCGFHTDGAEFRDDAFKLWAKHAIRAMLDGVEPVADALRPFAECVEQINAEESDEEWAKFRLLIGGYRSAAKALTALDALKEAVK